MAKGSVRKKGKKWYYRFYVEDASGNRVQKEYPGTESKAETEAMLRKAIDDYENKRFIAKTENISLGDMLDTWVEEGLKAGPFSNGTVEHYQFVVARIKQHPISRRKLKTVTPEHLQAFFDLLAFGGTCEDFVSKGYMPGSLHSFSSVLNHSFRFAVFPKQYITFNPMQYVLFHKKQEQTELFAEHGDAMPANQALTSDMYQQLVTYLKEKNPAALLPVQISYYTGLRIGEVCGLSWNDVNLDDQFLTVRRSCRYNARRRRTELGTTKSNKIRVVDFGDRLASILKKARREQAKQRLKYGALYHRNYYRKVVEKNRVHYELYHLDGTAEIPDDVTEIPLVCVREDGSFESYDAISTACKMAGKRVPELEGFHFHLLRHTYTTNLLMQGALPKDVQELLGHADVNTTMNVYAHTTRETKRQSAKLLDRLAAGM